jgi:hypothetical protein
MLEEIGLGLVFPQLEKKLRKIVCYNRPGKMKRIMERRGKSLPLARQVLPAGFASRRRSRSEGVERAWTPGKEREEEENEREREGPLVLLGPLGTNWTAPSVQDLRGRGAWDARDIWCTTSGESVRLCTTSSDPVAGAGLSGQNSLF